MSKEGSFHFFMDLDDDEGFEVGHIGSPDEDPTDTTKRGKHGENLAQTAGRFGRQERRQAVFPGHDQHRRVRVKSSDVQPPRPPKIEEPQSEKDSLARQLSLEMVKALSKIKGKNPDCVRLAVEGLMRAFRAGGELFYIEAIEGGRRIPSVDKATQVLEEIAAAIQGNELLRNHLSCGRVRPSLTGPSTISVKITR